jgi:hypothetical protein
LKLFIYKNVRIGPISLDIIPENGTIKSEILSQKITEEE